MSYQYLKTVPGLGFRFSPTQLSTQSILKKFNFKIIGKNEKMKENKIKNIDRKKDQIYLLVELEPARDATHHCFLK